MTMVISKLPMDLLEEILSRVPLNSIGALRSTCKTWNDLSKDESFRDKHISKTSRPGKEFLMITGDHRVYLINVNLYKTHDNKFTNKKRRKNHDNKFDLSVKRKGTLITRENSGEVISIKQVYQCNGLLLCVLEDIHNRLVVWNPYLCKRRWIKWPSGGSYEIAFGYDKSSCGSFKILMFCYTDNDQYKIYDSNSNSWRVTDAISPDETLDSFGVSLKGDYYWYATDHESYGLLRCFDFTRERFARLPLRVDPRIEDGDDVVLCVVREEQLGLLVKRWDTLKMEVWVTNKIEPDAVSWTRFLRVDMRPLPSYSNEFSGFYVVEEENMVVVFGEGKRMFTSYIIGESGYFTKVDLRKCIDIQLEPFVASYVPTSAQIK